jgi:hypothetical protein
MEEDRIVCSACGYINSQFRNDCKNCGKKLRSEIEANRKKPLIFKSWTDVLFAGIGIGSLFIALIIGASSLQLVKPMWIEIIVVIFIFIVFSASAFYFLLLPLYILGIYLMGHEVTGGKIITNFSKELGGDERANNYINYVIIRFWPEKAKDSRPRLLTCRIIGKPPMPDEEDKLLVRYAVLNPNIVLLEGE